MGERGGAIVVVGVSKWFCLFLGVSATVSSHIMMRLVLSCRLRCHKFVVSSAQHGIVNRQNIYTHTHTHSYRKHTNNLLSYQHFTWKCFLFTFKIILVVTKRKTSLPCLLFFLIRYSFVCLHSACFERNFANFFFCHFSILSVILVRFCHV